MLIVLILLVTGQHNQSILFCLNVKKPQRSPALHTMYAKTYRSGVCVPTAVVAQSRLKVSWPAQTLRPHRHSQNCRWRWSTRNRKWSWLTCRSNSWPGFRNTQSWHTRRSPHCPTTHGCTKELDACKFWVAASQVTSQRTVGQWSVWTYIGILCGRFRFILQSKEEINNQLTDKQKTADEKIKELEVWIHERRLTGL